jgi:hypothetical protein
VFSYCTHAILPAFSSCRPHTLYLTLRRTCASCCRRDTPCNSGREYEAKACTGRAFHFQLFAHSIFRFLPSKLEAEYTKRNKRKRLDWLPIQAENIVKTRQKNIVKARQRDSESGNRTADTAQPNSYTTTFFWCLVVNSESTETYTTFQTSNPCPWSSASRSNTTNSISQPMRPVHMKKKKTTTLVANEARAFLLNSRKYDNANMAYHFQYKCFISFFVVCKLQQATNRTAIQKDQNLCVVLNKAFRNRR